MLYRPACNHFLPCSQTIYGLSALDTSDILILMTNQPKTAQKATLNEILDEICDLHGFQDRGTARRWLREALDAMKRFRLLHRLHGEIDLDINDLGELIVKRPKPGTKLANPQRTLIDDEGYTRPEEERPKQEEFAEPELAPLQPLFQRMLSAREAERKSKPRKTAKKRKSTQSAQTVKQTIPKKTGRPRIHNEIRPHAKQEKPNPGTNARIIFDALEKNGWDHIAARNEIYEQPIFDNYGEGSKRKGAVLAAIMGVKYRYAPKEED